MLDPASKLFTKHVGISRHSEYVLPIAKLLDQVLIVVLRDRLPIQGHVLLGHIHHVTTDEFWNSC